MSTHPTPVDLEDTSPVESLPGDDLVAEHRLLGEAALERLDPETQDLIATRRQQLWNEIRSRADTDEPPCPSCDANKWAQAAGGPVVCRMCGYEGRAADEEAVHEAWNAIQEEAEATPPHDN